MANDKSACNPRIKPLPLPCAAILPTTAVDSHQVSRASLNVRKTSANDVFDTFKESSLNLPLRAATLSRISTRRSSAANAVPSSTSSLGANRGFPGASSNLRALDLKLWQSSGTAPRTSPTQALSARASLPTLRHHSSREASFSLSGNSLRSGGRRGVPPWMAQATINEHQCLERKGVDFSDGVTFKQLQRVIKLESRFETGKPLLAPGRVITHHGTLWEEATSGNLEKTLVYVLSDIIVFGRPIPCRRRTSSRTNLDNQVILSLSDIKVEAVTEEPKLTISTCQDRVYTLIASDVSDRDVWFSTLSMQIRLHASSAAQQAREAENANLIKQYSSFSLDGSSILRAISPFPSPHGGTWNSLSRSRKSSIASIKSIADADVTWVPDEDALACMVCQTSKFGLMVRKHHCRICGRVICWKCSLLVQPEDDDRPLRACIECVSHANLTCDAIPAGQDRLSISSVTNEFFSPPNPT